MTNEEATKSFRIAIYADSERHHPWNWHWKNVSATNAKAAVESLIGRAIEIVPGLWGGSGQEARVE